MVIVISLPLLERQLIIRIRRLAGNGRSAGLIRGIGDDCAVLQAPIGWQLLVTTDLCVEDVHFRRKWHPARSVGHRCLARGLSDIAAMGGEPLACFLSLGLPSKLPQKWADDFLQGVLQLAKRFRTPLAGGDVSSSEKVTADIVVLGKVPTGEALLRSGARVRDRIYVTGELGSSAAVLGRLAAGEKVKSSAARSHFYPEPRIKIGRWLRRKKLATAMIDLSDGLSVDLAHVCDESGVSARIETNAIPVARNATLDQALHGGEDYELLFTAPSRVRMPASISGIQVTMIGEIRSRRAGAAVELRDPNGRTIPLKAAGWQHFAKI